MTQYDTTGTVNLFIKISSVNQTLYWGRSHQTLQTLWDISFSVIIPPPPPPGFIHLKQFFVKSWIQDTLQRKMRYNENKSVVNVNALVVTGKAIYAGSCYKVICHFTFAVEIRWCYHPKGTIHFLKLKKKRIWKCDFFAIASLILEVKGLWNGGEQYLRDVFRNY